MRSGSIKVVNTKPLTTKDKKRLPLEKEGPFESNRL